MALLNIWEYTQSGGILAVFSLCAIFGIVITSIRLLLFLFGVGDGADHDFSDDTLVGISLFSVSTFTMFFGLGGLAMILEAKSGTFLAVLAATILGIVAVAITGLLMRGMLRLKHNGSDIHSTSYLNKHGRAYITIKALSEGIAQIDLDGVTREKTVINESQEVIPSGSPLQVCRVEGNQLFVKSTLTK